MKARCTGLRNCHQMVTEIHRKKLREQEIVNKEVNISWAVNIYWIYFLLSVSLKDIKLYT